MRSAPHQVGPPEASKGSAAHLVVQVSEHRLGLNAFGDSGRIPTLICIEKILCRIGMVAAAEGLHLESILQQQQPISKLRCNRCMETLPEFQAWLVMMQQRHAGYLPFQMILVLGNSPSCL